MFHKDKPIQEPTHAETAEFERVALRELYRAYDQLNSSHRLDLCPAVLAFFDSDSRWGQWEPGNRRISIARRLLTGHPWFNVLAILRHEMAHQLVAEGEASEDAGSARPHGAAFQAACRRVGVPGPFARAGCDLNVHGLDWREHKRDEGTERLLEKVRKLLALATSTNEHEALLAMEKVREIYAKYNLEQAVAAERDSFASAFIRHGRKRIEAHQDRIVGILMGHFFVKAVIGSDFDPKSRETHRSIELIGSRANVLMAEYVYYFLLRQSEALVNEAAVRSPAAWPMNRLERKSFRLGVLAGFLEKLNAARKPASQAAGGGLVGRALVQFEGDSALDGYLAELYPRLGRRSSGGRTICHDSFTAGSAAGKTITLNRAVASSDGNQGRLLS